MGNEQAEREFEVYWRNVGTKVWAQTRDPLSLSRHAFLAATESAKHSNVWTDEQRAQYRADKGL